MTRSFFQITIPVLSALMATLTLVSAAQAATEKVIYSFFVDGTDATNPMSGLVFDSAGNLYGTTASGGSFNLGTVFELSPNGDGTWSESILHTFQGDPDGATPIGSLIFDSSGNLYGTTSSGGTLSGTVFELTPNGNGTWNESILYTFDDADGSRPSAGLIFANGGDLFGTTSTGGIFGAGTLFQLEQNGNGTWSEGPYYNFSNNRSSGGFPQDALAIDAAGNFYGTASQGGIAGVGNVFELTPAQGNWTINVLHNFTGPGDGAVPEAGLIFATADTLYGTTVDGGTEKCTCGTIFRLKRSKAGRWSEKVVHSFTPGPGNGPFASLVSDSRGNL